MIHCVIGDDETVWEGLIRQRFPDDDDLKVGVLQTTMELRKSVGALTQAVATLTEQVKDQGAKLDAMRHEVTAARASIKTAVWLLGGVAAVIAWLLYRLPPVVTAVLKSIRAGQG